MLRSTHSICDILLSDPLDGISQWYWKAKNNYESIERSTLILHEPSFATMNGLHRNYCCMYTGHSHIFRQVHTGVKVTKSLQCLYRPVCFDTGA